MSSAIVPYCCGSRKCQQHDHRPLYHSTDATMAFDETVPSTRGHHSPHQQSPSSEHTSVVVILRPFRCDTFVGWKCSVSDRAVWGYIQLHPFLTVYVCKTVPKGHPILDPHVKLKYECLPYQLFQVIGQGNYGDVYVAKDIVSQKTYAVKQLRWPSDFHPETFILPQLRHPHILTPLAMYKPPHQPISLIFEKLPCDLKQFQERRRPDTIQLFRWVTQLVEALGYLHQSGVLHRDIKPSNILLDYDGNALLCDFGCAVQLSSFSPTKHAQDYSSKTSMIGTLHYAAPESILGLSLDKSADIWSMGCVFAELWIGRKLFNGSGLLEQFGDITNFLGADTDLMDTWRRSPQGALCNSIESVPPRQMSVSLRKYGLFDSNHLSEIETEFVDLLDQMLIVDPKKRISAHLALQHSFVSRQSAFLRESSRG